MTSRSTEQKPWTPPLCYIGPLPTHFLAFRPASIPASDYAAQRKEGQRSPQLSEQPSPTQDSAGQRKGPWPGPLGSTAGQAIGTKWKRNERSSKPCSALERLFGELVLKKTTKFSGTTGSHHWR